MATKKAYSDLQQSKKLAEILPTESADMYFTGHQSIINPKEWEYEDAPKVRGKYIAFDDKRIFYPCWSLAALLGILPSARLDSSNDHYYRLHCMETFTEWHDNPVDACYEMIIKHHKEDSPILCHHCYECKFFSYNAMGAGFCGLPLIKGEGQRVPQQQYNKACDNFELRKYERN